MNSEENYLDQLLNSMNQSAPKTRSMDEVLREMMGDTDYSISANEQRSFEESNNIPQNEKSLSDALADMVDALDDPSLIISHENIAPEIVPEKILAEEVSTEVPSAEEMPFETMPIEKVFVEESPIEESPIEEVPIDDDSIMMTPVEETAIEEKSESELSIEDILAQMQAVEETPIEEAFVEMPSVEEMPAEEKFTASSFIEETPIVEMKEQEMSVEDILAQMQSLGDIPTEAPTVKEFPTEKVPVVEAPILEETPAVEVPIPEETPAVEVTAENITVEEAPAEEFVFDENNITEETLAAMLRGIDTGEYDDYGIEDEVALNNESTEEVSLNNVSLNNVSLNNVSLNNVSLNNGSLNNVSLNDGSLDNSSLNDDSLNETSSNIESFMKSSSIDSFLKDEPLTVDVSEGSNIDIDSLLSSIEGIGNDNSSENSDDSSIKQKPEDLLDDIGDSGEDLLSLLEELDVSSKAENNEYGDGESENNEAELDELLDNKKKKSKKNKKLRKFKAKEEYEAKKIEDNTAIEENEFAAESVDETDDSEGKDQNKKKGIKFPIFKKKNKETFAREKSVGEFDVNDISLDVPITADEAAMDTILRNVGDDQNTSTPQEDLNAKDRAGTKGFLANLLAKLFEEVEDEEEQQQQAPELTNEDIIAEIDAENNELIDIKEKKKGKKDKKAKKDKKSKNATGDGRGDEDSEDSEKSNSKKKKKEKKVKEPKEETSKEPTKKILSKKALIGLIAFCATLIAAVLILSVILPEHADLKKARAAYFAEDYDTIYDNLYGKSLSESDQILFNRAKTILLLQRRYDSYENRMKMGEKAEALDSLIEGLAVYDALIENGDLEVKGQLDLIKGKILQALQNDFNLTEEQADGLYQLEDEEYTRQLYSIVYDGGYVSSNADIQAESDETILDNDIHYEDGAYNEGGAATEGDGALDGSLVPEGNGMMMKDDVSLEGDGALDGSLPPDENGAPTEEGMAPMGNAPNGDGGKGPETNNGANESNGEASEDLAKDMLDVEMDL